MGGRAGLDTADYSASSAAWVINLAASSNHAKSGAETDMLTDIENVIEGSGADNITGTIGTNILRGMGGNDTLGGGGNFGRVRTRCRGNGVGPDVVKARLTTRSG